MNLEANKEALLEAIKAERAYQDAKWGPLSEQKAKSLAGWLTVIESELDESRVAWTRNKGNDAALEELVQVAATWTACTEQGNGRALDTWLPALFDNIISLGYLKEHEEPLDRPLEELLGELKYKHLAKCWATIRGSGQSYYFLELGRYIMLALLAHGVVPRGARVFEECMSCEGVFDATGYDVQDACPLCRQRWTREEIS